MAQGDRISPQEARQEVKSGALLVCAYDDEKKCKDMELEGSISLDEFRWRLPSLWKNQKAIFYCA